MNPALSLQPGEGSLVFRRRGDGTSVETIAARSPLKLLAPKNHGSFAWVFAANFGGGLVDGDFLRVDAHLHEGAAALLGTQSATKVYRSPNGCRQALRCVLERDACLVVLPDPVSPFEGARYEQHNDVSLAAGASLVLLDGFSCGRSARGERWAFSRYHARTEITREGRVVVLDATLLDADEGDLGERLGRFDALATLVVLGPRFRDIARHAREATVPLARRADVIVSTSPLEGDGAIVRVAGVSVERVTQAVRSSLRHLPETLGDDPFARKW